MSISGNTRQPGELTPGRPPDAARVGPWHRGASAARGCAAALRRAGAALAVEVRHLLLVLARAGGRAARHGALDLLEVRVGELDLERAERLAQPLARARA